MAALMPPDTSDEEKIIGGKLTIHQLGWLLMGFMIYAVVCILLCISTTLGFSVFILFLPLNIIGIPFAFKRYGDLTFYRYHKLRHGYKREIKIYSNHGNNDLKLKDMEIGVKERL